MSLVSECIVYRLQVPLTMNRLNDGKLECSRKVSLTVEILRNCDSYYVSAVLCDVCCDHVIFDDIVLSSSSFNVFNSECL